MLRSNHCLSEHLRPMERDGGCERLGEEQKIDHSVREKKKMTLESKRPLRKNLSLNMVSNNGILVHKPPHISLGLEVYLSCSEMGRD